jgi:peptide methionine sulfoxide reductase MsrB
MFRGLKKNSYLAKYFIKEKYSPEDVFVSNYTNNIKNGFYVDIGAHHPLNQNNTFLLKKKIGVE